ncbi:cytoplasmic protein, partial [mine drainage metagenome]
MAKEWILNSATNRFQLNFTRNVGKVSEEIRKCSPRTIQDWETYYYSKVYPREHLVDLGRKLYVKITEVLVAEIDSVTEN